MEKTLTQRRRGRGKKQRQKAVGSREKTVDSGQYAKGKRQETENYRY